MTAPSCHSATGSATSADANPAATGTPVQPQEAPDVYAARKAALGAALRSAKLRALADALLTSQGPMHIAGLGPCIALEGKGAGTDHTAEGAGFSSQHQAWVEAADLMPATLLALVHHAPVAEQGQPQPATSHPAASTDPALEIKSGPGARTTAQPASQALPDQVHVSSLGPAGPGLTSQLPRLYARTFRRPTPFAPAQPPAASGSGSSSDSYSEDFEGGEVDGQGGWDGEGGHTGQKESETKQDGGHMGGQDGGEDEYSEDFEPAASSSARSVSTAPIAGHYWEEGGSSSESASLAGAEDGGERAGLVGAAGAGAGTEALQMSMAGGQVSVSGGGAAARASLSGVGAGTGVGAGAQVPAALANKAPPQPHSQQLRAKDEAFSPDVVRARVGAMRTAASAEVRERWGRARLDPTSVARMLQEGAALRAAVEAALGQQGAGGAANPSAESTGI